MRDQPSKQPRRAAAPQSFRENLREIWRFRELLFIFVQRDLKVRYKNSALGFGWSLANPLAQVVTITLVLSFLTPPAYRTQNYHVYVFCATLPWLFFSTTLMDAANSLLGHYQIMRRTYFPRELIPMASVVSNLIHFGLAIAVFLAYVLGNALFWWALGKPLNLALQPTVLLLPIPILGLIMLAVGLSLFVSVWTLYFEDMRYILDNGFKVLYWLTPVLYFAEKILTRDPWGRGQLFYTLYMLNPLAALITAFQMLTLRPTKEQGTNALVAQMGSSEWIFLGIAMVTSALILLAGLRFFNHRKWALAERG